MARISALRCGSQPYLPTAPVARYAFRHHRPSGFDSMLHYSSYLRRRLSAYLCVARISTNHQFACDLAP